MNIRKACRILFLLLIITLSFFMLTPRPPQIGLEFRFIDKLEHFAAFFILAVLLGFSYTREKRRKPGNFAFRTAVLGIYGILIEVIQQFTGRTAEISDIFADLAGNAAGCILSLFFL